MVGCQTKSTPKGRSLVAQSSESQPAEEAQNPHSPHQMGAKSAPPPEPPSTGPLKPTGKAPTFAPLTGWTSQTPTSSMRAAQYVLPKADGDPEDATLIVYYFNGQGGSVEANFDRWISQFQQPDGKDSKSAAQKSHRTIAEVEIHLLDISGTYVAETAPGSGQRVNKPNFSSRNAIMLSSPGPYFIRLVGPQKTVERYTKDFDAFLEKSLQ